MAETTQTVDPETERRDALTLFGDVVRALLELGVSAAEVRAAVDGVLDE